MNQLHYLIPDGISQVGSRPRRAVAVVCLAVSIVLHLAAIALVLAAYTQSSPGTAVTYLDLKSIGEPAAPAVPMIHPASRPDESSKADQPEPLPRNSVQESRPEPSQSLAQEIESTPLGRGMAHGYFSSFAEGKNLRGDLREYYLMLLERVNERWWQKSATLTETAVHDAVVVFVIGKGGELVDLTMTKSTGSRLVDRAIMELLKEMAPYPPFPDSYALEKFLVPLKIAAPLRLFRGITR